MVAVVPFLRSITLFAFISSTIQSLPSFLFSDGERLYFTPSGPVPESRKLLSNSAAAHFFSSFFPVDGSNRSAPPAGMRLVTSLASGLVSGFSFPSPPFHASGTPLFPLLQSGIGAAFFFPAGLQAGFSPPLLPFRSGCRSPLCPQACGRLRGLPPLFPFSLPSCRKVALFAIRVVRDHGLPVS